MVISPFGVEHLPPPLMTSEPGTFAFEAVAVRFPQILDAVLAAHPYPADIVQALAGLREEILGHHRVRPLTERTPDRPEWDAVWASFAGRDWFSLPWYPAEAYFYRRVLEAVHYFLPGRWQGVDPYGPQKHRELEEGGGLDHFAPAWAGLPAGRDPRLSRLLSLDLWGNRADMSIAEMAQDAAVSLHRHPDHFLLVDHRPQLTQTLAEGDVRRVDLIADNVGIELMFDLALAGELLAHWGVGQVCFHLKPQPFFVSDAMIPDVEETRRAMAGRPELAPLTKTLDAALASGRFVLEDHPFWVSAYGFHRMPAAVREHIAAADVVFIKGDANYRRLLDDRAWPETDSLAERTRYFPAPFVSIRVCKAELVLDVTAVRVRELEASDPRWRVDGRYGLIRYVPRAHGGAG